MNWIKAHKIWSLIIALLFIGVIAAAAGGENNKNGTSNDNQQTAKQEKQYRFADRADKQTKDREVLSGETADIDGLKLTVATAEYKTQLSEFETAASGKTYLEILVKIENQSDRTKPYNVFDFRVQTAGGQVLDPAFTTGQSLGSGDLVTGGKVEGKVIFEVPVEEGHQYVIWKPGIESDRAIVQTK